MHILAITYVVVLCIALVKQWQKIPKSALSGFVSGTILLAYSTYLFVVEQIKERPLILLLAVALLQLSSFEVGNQHNRINWKHQVIRLIIHGVIVYGFLIA